MVADTFEILRDWWHQQADPDLRRSALLAIALLYSEISREFLLALIAMGKRADVQDAYRALEVYQENSSVWEQVQRAVESRKRANQLLRVGE
ncbi:hypothetical protein IFO70_05915 [Phormidium tenue FACHB-886]|nr:hypothetical protein [Phormidium tenue FACHB-886]